MKFHGRFECKGRVCEAPGCEEAGEFRAPGDRRPGFDGPGDFRWFCLEHVRQFNAGYDWFEGMSADEILTAQSPIAGWATETRAFKHGGASDGVPRWADFADPLDAIGQRAHGIRREARARQGAGGGHAAGHTNGPLDRFTPREREALGALGLSPNTDRSELRRRYSELVRRYHPDRNGGDRSQEGRLARVVAAYNLLRAARAFA